MYYHQQVFMEVTVLNRYTNLNAPIVWYFKSAPKDEKELPQGCKLPTITELLLNSFGVLFWKRRFFLMHRLTSFPPGNHGFGGEVVQFFGLRDVVTLETDL